MILIFAGLVAICIVILVSRTIHLFNAGRGLEKEWDELVERMAKERAEMTTPEAIRKHRKWCIENSKKHPKWK